MSKHQIGIFGMGRFGQLVASVLKQYFQVKVYKHKPGDEELARRIGVDAVDMQTAASCDYVYLCAPISATEELIKKISKHVKPGALVMDACSVKVYPCKWLKKYIPKQAEIMGTHPMFGPTTSQFNLKKQEWNIKGKQVILCPLRVSQEKVKLIQGFLGGLGLKVIRATPAEHDRQNAYTLGLVHYIGRSLKSAGVKEQDIYTPGFADLLRITPHTTGDNWQLFYDMHNFNPYAQRVRFAFVESCLKMDKRIEEHNRVEEIKYGRKLIDRLDGLFVHLLEYRLQVSQRIGALKKGAQRGRKDVARENEIINNISQQTSLPKPFVSRLYNLILSESRRQQK